MKTNAGVMGSFVMKQDCRVRVNPNGKQFKKFATNDFEFNNSPSKACFMPTLLNCNEMNEETAKS
jgi:hypothetical protein